MIKRLFLQIFVFWFCLSSTFAHTFVLTPECPDLKTTVGKALPGDTILLTSGTYPAEQVLLNIHGLPERPVYITGEQDIRGKCTIIDGQTEPGNNLEHFAFSIKSSSWLVFENLQIINCWTDVVIIKKSSYISFRNCHFRGGRRVIYPQGKGCHHFLVEGCTWNQSPEVWQTDFSKWESHRDWWADMHHGEKRYFNGALLHPWRTEGCYVMRNCTIRNAFNAFRTRPKRINQDGNGEVYSNTITNIRDNEFEPEVFAWNIHFYHNTMKNIHNIISMTDVKGGYMYIYGNTWTQDNDAYTRKIVINVWKYSLSPFAYPVYAFNNSFYTLTKLFGAVRGHSNKGMQHFNNAYHIDGDSGRMALYYWDDSFSFDHDCVSRSWPKFIYDQGQEQNGLLADPGFIDPACGNFMLQPGSPCIDAGKVLRFPELAWIQEYTGDAPDIGAYEGSDRVTGPPFMYREPPGGNTFREKPRITRHVFSEDKLVLYFSWPLDPGSLKKDDLVLLHGAEVVPLSDLKISGRTMVLELAKPVVQTGCSLKFKKLPSGTNGEAATGWASTIQVITLPERTN